MCGWTYHLSGGSYSMSGWRLWRWDGSRGTPLAVRRWCVGRVASTRRWWPCTWTWRTGQLQEVLLLLRAVLLPFFVCRV